LAVARNDGRIVASEGSGAATAWIDVIPLEAAGEVVGELRVGATRTGAPLSPRDQELIRTSAAYLAAALRAGRREDEQVEQLAGLVEERAAVDSKASSLHAALVHHADLPAGLRVLALGPLHVERAGARIERWGGDKAGSRQAQGVFAFLLDRGERGLSKDEALELIWPDTDLDRADLAFHRTMVGLRQTLDPRRDGRTSQVIRFHNDRYRLDPSIIAWSDVAAFLERLDAAKRAADPMGRLAILEEARALYRGDYLDDCPFYGDSAEVEAQRDHLRGRATDLRIAIGEAYEAVGDRLSAADAFREAIRGAPGGSAPAQAGLSRLGI
jgi:DNA-binding SARP family transcriptional activator